jgi:hypothetical protein
MRKQKSSPPLENQPLLIQKKDHYQTDVLSEPQKVLYEMDSSHLKYASKALG